MPLTREIPREAMPVVRILREKKETRQGVLPRRTVILPMRSIRFEALRWGTRCPMGLHPESQAVAPFWAATFLGKGKISDKAVKAFAFWWDDQHDARAAVRAVWGNG